MLRAFSRFLRPKWYSTEAIRPERLKQINAYFEQYIDEYYEEAEPSEPATLEEQLVTIKPVKIRSRATVDALKSTLEENRAYDIVCVALEGLPQDYAVICSPRNVRHSKSVVDVLHSSFVTLGRDMRERKQVAWKVIDFGDIILHIMPKDARAHYDLETLWITGGDDQDASDSIDNLLPPSK